ncbi:MAG: BTAD domain-containing putative transcriptional regulator [SAR202 cluster bacterium]|nr:BTAD domain-containing putative transcriptional regulator [SAR202 cluster bacterium]
MVKLECEQLWVTSFVEGIGMTGAADLVHNASDPGFATDREGRLIVWNSNAERLFGYKAEEALGRRCYEVVRAVLPDGQPLCTPECNVNASLCGGIPSSIRSCLCPTKDGRWVRVSFSTVAVPDDGDSSSTAGIMFARPINEPSLRLPPAGMLRICTLGRFSLSVGDSGVDIQRWQRKQALTLFKHLVTHRGNAVHRERLIDSIWPDATETRGRERLKVTVYSLRRELRDAGVENEVIGSADDAYSLRKEAVWLDAEVFDDLVSEGDALARLNRSAEAIHSYREADDLFQGDYLEEDLYADWCADERARLRDSSLHALQEMASLNADKGDLVQAVQLTRKALAREPARESLHRSLMLYLSRQGRIDEALVPYDACKRVLADMLGVAPHPETRRLHAELVGFSETTAPNPSS